MRPSLADNASPEEWAEAMVACQGWPESCSRANECLYDGQCFAKPGQTRRRALTLLKRMISDQEDDDVAMWLEIGRKAIEAGA